ncbi:Potassium voltage-gated channel subfamily H member 7 [Durusdinium trenchii]|uniref:Potassium voltage-gated channel subfamily H member 7 n=1 Tax=Durusdinium trenchii TaxID=1381693 RepID=A0ABP0M8F5_9DINO
MAQAHETSLKREKTTKDRAHKEKLEHFTRIAGIMKVNPSELKLRLREADDTDMKVHHEALTETQDEVEDHLEFITSLQLLNQAMRGRELQKWKAQESVMQMFATRCLSTIYAWMISAFWFEILKRVIIAMDPELAGDDISETLKDWRAFVGYLIYAVLAWLLVPIIQWKIREFDDKEDKYSRLHAAVDLQAKAMPMVLAWAFKDVVQYFLQWTDQVLWDEIVVSIVVVLFVTAATHCPPVKRAKKQVSSKEGDWNTLKNRYLNLPSNMLLGAGYSINQVASFCVKWLSQNVLPLVDKEEELTVQFAYNCFISVAGIYRHHALPI